METDEIENVSEFTLSEVLEMEHLYKKRGDELQQQEHCEELATKFSRSDNRNGKSTVSWDQVHNWFLDRQTFAKVKSKSLADAVTKKLPIINSSPNALKKFVAKSEAWAEAEKLKKPKAQRVAELSDLMYEAISSKDCAWFDVAQFMTFRIMHSGELEVRVRFSGFSPDEDEWVNVRTQLRERSIPLVASECDKVNIGDLVLCYRANEDHALYSDAHVTKVERQMHDNENCTCTFVVRFQYDGVEMDVKCNEICRRPS
ncbi:protein SAWADEE HOMEODOMAIN HOMOLOG 1 [Rutidosis leptorrhynchoides]|uniref:protein SAWADEE HOMEODOMAIN HOMOLOG 1 n=1 Tax=Rutidosis leptorrhynchoides TaxID=125765 RepID=UPI003A998FB6